MFLYPNLFKAKPKRVVKNMNLDEIQMPSDLTGTPEYVAFVMAKYLADAYIEDPHTTDDFFKIYEKCFKFIKSTTVTVDQ
jgi:hypothetical protein